MVLAVGLLSISNRGMDVTSGSSQRLMTQEDLDGSRIGTFLGEVGGKTVPQRMC